MGLILIGAECGKEESKKSEKEKDKKEDQYENFLTYESKEWKFEIKYPNDWEKQEESSDTNFTVGFLTPQENVDDSARENVVIFVSMPEPQNFDDLMAQAIEEIPQDSNANLMDYSKVMVSGYPGYKLNYSYTDYYNGKLLYLHYFINAGDKWYQMLYVALESTYSQYLAQAQTMINSFVIK